MGSLDSFSDGSHSLKWHLENEVGLVVVAVYQKHLSLTYVDELLLQAKAAFLPLARGADLDALYPSSQFTPTFLALHAEAEKRALAERITAKKQR